ncbi:TMEM175 family protein [Gordonia sp. CPCC 205515]|uniref:TMEM175 family protein n=1 Tax=Gordonia sp. CPCC 205515 TaxID=3140791 RepID=UPI003AF407AB
MSTDPERRSEEGFRRLMAFSDAVVAIALTLLVLPLAEIAGDLDEPTTVWQVLADHQSAIISFLISFVVIWVLWRNHHRIGEYFNSYDPVFVNLNFVWLLTIVLLPFATALIAGDRVERANVLYIGVLAVSILTEIAMTWWGSRHRELLEDAPDVEAWLQRRHGVGTAVALVIALIVAIVVPDSGVWPLFLLLLSGPIEGMLTRFGWRSEAGSSRDQR